MTKFLNLNHFQLVLIIGILIFGVFISGCSDQSSISSSTPAPTPLPTKVVHQVAVTTTSTQNLETGLSSRSYPYILRGKSDTITLNLYSGVYNYFTHNLIGSYRSADDFNHQVLDNPIQKKYLQELINAIKSKTKNRDDQARIAISLVQRIPYDDERARLIPISSNLTIPRPYEVIYNNKGVCQDKSFLLAYILRELDYGVVLFHFADEKHQAVGVKAPSQFDYQKSGYAFIETAFPAIPTDSQEGYAGGGQLTSKPYISKISDGNSFDSISEEYNDMIAYYTVSGGGTSWQLIREKYGL